MDKIVKFYRNVGATAAGGGTTDNYTLLVTTRGELKTNSGSRSGGFNEIGGTTSHTLMVRKQNTLFEELHTPQVREAMSLKVTVNEKVGLETIERRFTIHSWHNVQEDYTYLKFDLTEQLV